jgi:hypothetical protein
MRALLCLAFLASSIALPACAATAAHAEGQDEPGSNPTLKRLHEELTTLFKEYYPKVTSRIEEKKDRIGRGALQAIRFEYDVTTFEFPYEGKPGRKHESTTLRGPKKGGILCNVYLEKG